MTGQELLKDCLDRLSRSGLNYMLVGSMAGNYWGIPRSTHDIDFVIQYEPENIDQIVSPFENDFFIQKTSVEAALRAPHQFNTLDNRSALKVDFFSGSRVIRMRWSDFGGGDAQRFWALMPGLPRRGHCFAQIALVFDIAIGSAIDRHGGNSVCIIGHHG